MSAKNEQNQTINKQILMAISALGVVYGDIGTSPLYALKEALHHGHSLLINESTIFGILSLVFWSLALVITVKYLSFILKADNRGEGGILALTALITGENEQNKYKLKYLILLGIFGTSLLYGDGIITPAISVLSAVEGLELITPMFNTYIIPITIIILISLFSIQRFGTSTMGKVFGPITLLWFITLGGLGLYNILKFPTILNAMNPKYAIDFFIINQWKGFLVLGSVFLVVTGGEALYSDLGHFGRKPIARAWFFIALPCLLLNYFGQGAFISIVPTGIKNPFFLMAPSWMLTPLVILATMATVIASQALITGVFSITMHAVHLGYIPRVLIKHTSKEEYGQIYVKSVNYFLMIACIALVLVFKTSSNLAAAYGIAVTMTMMITTILFYVVARNKFKWSALKAILICSVFLIFDIAFLGANILKVFDGGWVPLLVGILILVYMTTWKRGRELLEIRNEKRVIPINQFIEKSQQEKINLLPGTAIFMSNSISVTPLALVNIYSHFKAIHKNIIVVQVVTEEIPVITAKQKYKVVKFNENFHAIELHYGYIEEPNIPADLSNILIENKKIDLENLNYFLGKENLFATELEGMAIWRERLFALQTANAQDATAYFQLPKKQVVEIGVQIEL
jgi:KUP system potassium uptake protein